ncbi:uracil-DNA glycosylase family protein [Streptomyces sp. NPDC014622]|uniref:uracil-DNA glycosylase family protein n=1 Tax=Streptomyces sp. NPDC014622 TaxID=3364874 RepID=UPI00370136AD
MLPAGRAGYWLEGRGHGPLPGAADRCERKHFKFAPLTGAQKWHIHKASNLREITACRPWPAAELRRIDPELVVALGATAGKALFRGSFRVTQGRGALLSLPDWDIPAAPDAAAEGELNGHRLRATVHPSEPGGEPLPPGSEGRSWWWLGRMEQTGMGEHREEGSSFGENSGSRCGKGGRRWPR